MLSYKTRGESSPQGKPRVYFCCHPGDFETYFERISDEILEKQNCAVYYYEYRKEVEDEELELDLSQMQLFVMPVTSRLLAGNNAGIDDFNYAVKRHIPVLPLMQEAGLDGIFNKVCGEIQYLENFSNDSTAIKYEQKLEKFLSAALIGDALAEKIRAAFDAYIFLSYRKKDRKYAQELMRLIHSNEKCRDIAIWYDEFLTPGENFNESIKDALDKSSLFALAVTPNVVNEENYVMTVEYPMAVSAGKRIAPFEMADTDLKLLKKLYSGIDDPAAAGDCAAVNAMLLKSVEGLAVRENDDDPQHNFFIGLAYLSGIDMEVDYDRALELITSAANDGLVEAIDKLAVMYENGEGVERDYSLAASWQKKAVMIYRDAYENSPGCSTAIMYMVALEKYADKCSAAAKLNEGVDALKKALELRDEALKADDDEVVLLILRIYDSLSMMLTKLGDKRAAIDIANDGIGFLESRPLDTVELKENLFNNYIMQSQLCRMTSDLDGAVMYCDKAAELIDVLIEDKRGSDSFYGTMLMAGIVYEQR